MSAAAHHDSHPELANEFNLLDRVFREALHAATIKRVLSRCCFLFPGTIPADLINTGEKSGGNVPGIRIADPDERRAPAPEGPAPEGQYICDWIKEMDDWHLFTGSFIEDGAQYISMSPSLQLAAAILLLNEDSTILFNAFHTIVRELRALFPGHLPLSQILPADGSSPKIVSPLRNITGNQIHAAHQSYAAHLQHIPWTGPSAALTQRLSSLRTLQSLLNDLGWYHIHQSEFAVARTLSAAAHHTTTHALVHEWVVHNPAMAAAPFPPAVFHQELDTLVLCTYAWAWSSLDEQSAGDMDAWFSVALPDMVVNDGFFMQGYRRAQGFWGEVVEKMSGWVENLDGEGGGGGEEERRRRVVERLEGLYGSGRRMAVFWQFEESFDWELQQRLEREGGP